LVCKTLLSILYHPKTLQPLVAPKVQHCHLYWHHHECKQLNLDDLLHASTSTNILKVLGNSGDKVNAAGFSDSTIDKTVDGITYDVYSHGDANTGANVELWVQQEVVLF
jgi:hypothetical protein